MGLGINGPCQNRINFTDVVAKVIEIATQLVDSEMAGIMLYSEENNELVLQKPAFKTSDDDIIGSYRVPLSAGGNAVSVYNTGKPYISNDTIKDPRYIQRYIKLFGARKNITVPLETGNRRIGIMHVDNKKKDVFTPEDLSILTFFAPHLALFIENALLYQQELANADELVKVNNKMLLYQQRLERLVHSHNKLIRQVLNEEGMHFIVKTLGDLVDAPVYVEDAQHNLLVSTGQYSSRDSSAHTFKDVHALDHYNYVHNESEKVGISTPIIGGENIMGYIKTILDPYQVNDDLAMIALEQGATVLALEMMREKVRIEIESRYRRELLDNLFHGHDKDVDNIYKQASYFAYDLSACSRVAVLSIGERKGLNSSDDHQCSLLDNSLHNLLVALVRKAFPGVFTATSTRTIDLLIPMGSLGLSDLNSNLNEIVEQAVHFYPEKNICVGVGSACSSVDDYHKSFKNAGKALAIAKALGDNGGILIYELLGVYSLLFEISDQDILKEFVRARIGPLLEHDAKKNLSLIDTLEKYLKTGGSLKETAQALYIHVATLKYRLRRIQELLSVDVKQPENRFDLQLALYAKRVLKAQLTGNRA